MCGSAVCNNMLSAAQFGGGGGGGSCCSLLTKSILTNDRKERYLSLECQQSGKWWTQHLSKPTPEILLSHESYENIVEGISATTEMGARVVATHTCQLPVIFL